MQKRGYMEEERKEIKLLNPKLDYVFKRIFGYVGNEEITENLLNSILENKIWQNLNRNQYKSVKKKRGG